MLTGSFLAEIFHAFLTGGGEAIWERLMVDREELEDVAAESDVWTT